MDGTTRQRVGRGLRVYLERPWFSSGDDEKLGVVLVQPLRPTAGIALPGIPPILHRYTSQWGSDPVTSSPVPNVDREMAPEHIVNAEKVVVENLSLDEVPPSPALAVRAVGLPVEFNAERRLWYCDIEFDPGRAYYPYVNLSLARLQEHAIPDAHLSRVVRTEFAQLVADRTATINRRTDGNIEILDVTVIGVSAPTDAGNKLLAPVIIPLSQAATLPPTAGGPPVVQPPPIIGQVRNPAAGAGHSVRVYIERRRAGTPGDLGWERDSDDFTLDSYTFSMSPEVFWKGSLRRLLPTKGPANEYRLVIREFEVYDTDPLVAERIPGLSNPAQRSLGERLVYLDIFPLP
jgi:hypothetical protein